MKLEVHLFNEETQLHQLDRSRIYVGRSSQCDIVINHESMSRKHCLIEIEGGQIYVTDLNSTNGVSIDGSRITSSQRILYLNSLPLTIGAANITIDLTDHQTGIFTAPAKNTKTTSPSISSKTTTSQRMTREKTSSLNVGVKANKKRQVKKEKTSTAAQPKKVKELMVAIIAVLIFGLMAMWHFNQN